MGWKITDLDPNWAFPDCNSNLNRPFARKWHTKLGVASKKCPIVFQGHLSNFKVTRDQKLQILTQIGCFWTVTRVVIHCEKACEMMHKAWSSIEEVPYCFSRSSVKFQGPTGRKIAGLDPNWAFPDCNSSLNWPLAKKWHKNFGVAQKKCPIVFQGHPSEQSFEWISQSRIPCSSYVKRLRRTKKLVRISPQDMCINLVVISQYAILNWRDTTSVNMGL